MTVCRLSGAALSAQTPHGHGASAGVCGRTHIKQKRVETGNGDTEAPAERMEHAAPARQFQSCTLLLIVSRMRCAEEATTFTMSRVSAVAAQHNPVSSSRCTAPRLALCRLPVPLFGPRRICPWERKGREIRHVEMEGLWRRLSLSLSSGLALWRVIDGALRRKRFLRPLRLGLRLSWCLSWGLSLRLSLRLSR